MNEGPIIVRMGRYSIELRTTKEAIKVVKAILREKAALDRRRAVPLFPMTALGKPIVTAPKSVTEPQIRRLSKDGEVARRLGAARAAKARAATGPGCKRIVERGGGFFPCSLEEAHAPPCR